MSTHAPDAPAIATTAALQDSLVELIDLSLQAKHYHWTVTGREFRAVHLQLDEITDEVRLWYDEVAERLATLDVAPDGRTATVAAQDGQVPRKMICASSIVAPGTSASRHGREPRTQGTSTTMLHERHTRWWCQAAAVSYRAAPGPASATIRTPAAPSAPRTW